MIFIAVLSNPDHPEYGVASVPFPILREQYCDRCGFTEISFQPSQQTQQQNM